MYNILNGMRSTEKSHDLAEKHRQFTFQVIKDATKEEIKTVIEEIFSVNVLAVRVANVKGKAKKFKQRLGQRSSWKKAVVSLKEGQDINIAEFN